MTHSSGSQRDTGPRHSHLVSFASAPTAASASEPGGDSDDESSLPWGTPWDTPKFLHPATPRKAKISNCDVLHKRKGYYTQMGNREMEHRYAPVDLDTFFKAYVPKPARKLSGLKKIGNFSHVPYSDVEETMYAPLCETFRKLREATQSPFIVLDTAGRNDKADPLQDIKPDLCLYDTTYGSAKYVLDDTERMASEITDENRREHLGRTAWAWMTSFIEVKSSSDSAPFNFDDTDEFEIKDTDSGKRSRAQVIKYVSEIQHRQHRTFVLCAFIWRDWVRFMRWDRAGAIVSTAYNYVEDPSRLLNFIYSLSMSSREGQGYDTSVTLLTPSAPHIAKTLNDVRQSLTKLHDVEFFDGAFTGDMYDYPLYELTCADVPYRAEDREAASEADRERAPPEHRTNTYWISAIHAGTRSPTGRGTKGFVAIDIDHRQMVFLKDYWCPNLKGVHPELETYARLRESRVQYVATALAGGIVLGPGPNGQPQTTVTQERLKTIPHDESSIPPPEAFHYRFVVREIGQPLETYACSSHLWEIVTHTVVGHQDAYEKAKVLHRDMSAKNILINPLTQMGLIIDWDLAKHMDTDGELQSSQSGRSGTWPFMSAKLLQLPRKPNDLADDLESFIYVICVMFLCYHKHSISPLNLAGNAKDFSPEANARNTPLSQHLTWTFYSNTVTGRYHYGGQLKLTQIEKGDPGFKMAHKTLNLGISKLYTLLRQHYEAYPVDDLRAQWGVPEDAEPESPVHEHTLRQRFRWPRLPAEHQTVQAQPKVGPSSTASLAPAIRSVQGTKTVGLHTHQLILDVLLSGDVLDARWPDDDKTFPQFEKLPNTDGTEGTEVASSLAGSSTRGSKHSLDFDEGDETRELKKMRRPSRFEQGLQAVRRSSRQGRGTRRTGT